MDFENSKPDFEADFSGDSDSEKAADYSGRTSSALALELQASGQAPLAQIGAQNTVVLPDGVNLDDIRVVGRDLVITLPDGSEMIIPDGAVFIPQIVIGGVTVPPLNLAALLVGNEPQPAAGPPQSSGGNFADPVGDIGDPFALGDLLPPTALSFTEPENEEIFPFEPEDDAVPDVVIVTPENPAGSANATDSVDEAGLPARGAESEGSNAAGNGETTAGTIVFSAGDAPAIVSIIGVSVNGVAITAVGQTVQGAFGTLTITSINNGSIGYSYTLSDNTDGDATSDFFEVSVVDADGDSATANLTINIVDDVPTAVADSDSIAAGEYGPATGNVITDAEADGGADTQGADGAVVAGVAAGDTGTALVDAGTVGTTIAGLYGVLTLNANGSYSYVRNADSAGGVQDVFTYTLQDGDGDTSVTTLTIDIADSPVTLNLPVSGEAGAVVDEEGLPTRGSESPGSNAAADSETTSGTITYSATDGPAVVTINGVAVTTVGQTFAGASGTLTITGIANGAITYSYTLTDNTSGDNTSDDFAISVSDQDGDNAAGTLSIAIIDDVPTAVADTDSIAAGEYGPATGNVITDAEADGGADTQGADGAVVAGVAAGDTGAVLVDAGTVGTTIAGLYGVLTLNADGSYSYARNADSPGGVQDVFTYTLQDGDGDTSVTTLTIDIADSPVTLTLPVSGEAGAVVDEEGLPARGSESPGSNTAADSETTSGTIAYDAADGPATVAINGVAVTVVGQTFVGASGVLTITGIANGAITYSYTLADNTSGDNTSDDFAISVSDQDGDNATGTLSIAIIDDLPDAMDEATQTVDEGAVVTGTLDFVQGADSATVTQIDGVTLIFGPDGFSQSIDIGGGSIRVKADGSYEFTADDPTISPVALTTATYTVTDGDGDIDTANIGFQILDANVPVGGETLATVDDDGLAGGNSASDTGDLNANVDDLEIASEAIFQGVLNFSFGGDGAGTVDLATMNGLTAMVGQEMVTYSWDGGSNTLTATGPRGVLFTVEVTDPSTGAYTVTLVDNVLHAQGPNDENNAIADLNYTVTDADGSTATGFLTVVFDDDAPTATDEASQDVNEGATVTGTLDFAQGADGATVTHIGATVLAFGPDGFSQSIDIGDGSIRVKADGSYEFTADNPVASPTPPTTATFTVTDADGDTATANVSFQVVDANVPTAGTSAAEVDDDGLAGGNPLSTIGDQPDANADGDNDESTFGGTLTLDFGGDGAGTVDFASMNGLTGMVGQEMVTYSWDGGSNTLTATGPRGVLFTVEVTDPSTGAYTVTLVDNVLHAQGPNDENDALVSLNYNVTDADGSVAAVPGTLNITFDDDAPTAVDINASQATENQAFTIALAGNYEPGADGVDLATGVSFTQASQGVVTYDDNGTFTYTPASGAGSTSTSDSFTYTITDADGDSVTKTVNITLQPDSAPVAVDVTASLDDDGLAVRTETSAEDDDANAGEVGAGVGNEAVWTGMLSVSAGSADSPLTYSLAGMVGSGTVGTEDVLYTWSAGTNTLTATTDGGTRPGTILFTAQITDVNTGAYTLTLVNPIMHPTLDGLAGDNTENNTTVVLTYSVTDSDTPTGDSDTGTITINFDDDAPTAVDINASQATENQAFTIALAGNYEPGADGVDLATGVSFTQASQGVVTYDDNGTFTYTPASGAGSTSTSDSFTYTITDADGDSVTKTVNITLQPDSAPVAVDVTASLDDDGLAVRTETSAEDDDANAGEVGAGVGNEAVWTGMLSVSAGSADSPLTYSLAGMVGSGTVGTEDVLYTWSAGTNTLTATTDGGTRPGTILFTAQITDVNTGAYTLTLVNPIMHPTLDGLAGDNTENNTTVVLTYSVTDSDTPTGDSDTGTITINFDDDAPTAVDINASQATENQAFTIALAGNYEPGADGVDLATGVSFTQASQGVVTYDDNGTFTYTPASGAGSTSTSDSFTYTITDADGDSVTKTVNITLQPDSAPVAVDVTASLDDDGLAVRTETSAEDDDANAGEVGAGVGNEAVWTGMLSVSAGSADSPLTYSLAGMVGSGTVGTEDVLYTWSAGTNTLTATTDGGTRPGTILFTAQITDVNTGAYTLTLVNPIMHPTLDGLAGDNTENNTTVVLTYSVTDSDTPTGDSDTGTITINFDDDAPTLGSFSDETLPNAVGSVNGTFTYGPGADGHDSFNITGPTLDGVTNTVVQNANGALLTATVDGSGEILYTLQVNTDGTYEFSLVTPDAGSTETISLLGLGASGPDGFLEVPAGNVEFTDNGTGEGINSSTQGFGVQNQFVGNGQSFTMEFHDPGIVGDEPTATNPNLIDSVALGNNNINGSLTIRWTATNSVTSETETGVIVVSGTSTLIDPTISFNHLLIEGIGGSGQGVRFSSLDITKQIIPQDLNLPFQVSAVDGDGDVTQLDDFNVFIDASLAPTLAPLAPTSIIEPISFIGVESVQLFQSSDSDEQLVSNDNDGLMLRNADGPVEDVALVESVAPTSSMLQNANESQMARAAINSKAQTISQIAVAATLLAANGRPEETAGDNEVPNVELTDSVVPDVAQNQAQPEAVQLENVQIANDEGGSSVAAEASSSGGSSGSGEPPVESSIVAGEAMIVEESSGNNAMQPGFDASEFQSASGLQLDMGIAMNMEALAVVGDAPSPEQLDVTAPPATVEEIVADAIDGGSPEVVTIDAVIEGFAGIDTGGAHGVLEHLPAQAMPEQILDLFVQGDAGLMFSGAADPMQTQMDMVEAGHAAG